MVKIGKKAPKWNSTVYNGGNKETMSHEDLLGSWYVIYWWPFDFTGVCHSEVEGFQALESDFEAAGIKLIGASCDSFHSHRTWFSDQEAFPNGAPSHPIIADNTHQLTKDFGFYHKKVGCALRATVLVSPEGIVMSAGANFLPVSRDPLDVLTTAKAFANGGACFLKQRQELRG